MEYHTVKSKELSEQLDAWWHTQTDFKTKKALAGFLKVHRDTIGDYFSGRTFPKLDIANKLYQLTKITSLKPNASDGLSGEVIPQKPFTAPPLRSSVAPVEKLPVPDSSGAPVLSRDEYGLGRGERNMEKPTVISLQRTICPFCTHGISRFRSCGYCGQSFVWANVPKG